MGLPVTFASLPGGNDALSLFDTQFAAVASLGTIPCACSGTNSLALTPFANTPVISSYPDLAPSFIFAAAATSTGTVTANVALVGSRNVYKWNAGNPFGTPFQCGANDIVGGGVYRLTPLQALNGGAGGFVCDTVGVGNNFFDIEFIIDGGGSAITTGVKGYLQFLSAGTITNWSVMGDQSGSISIDILRANGAVPTTSMVGGGTKPNLVTQQANLTQAPTGWTSTLLASNDWLGFQVISATTVTRVTLTLQGLRS